MTDLHSASSTVGKMFLSQIQTFCHGLITCLVSLILANIVPSTSVPISPLHTGFHRLQSVKLICLLKNLPSRSVRERRNNNDEAITHLEILPADLQVFVYSVRSSEWTVPLLHLTGSRRGLRRRVSVWKDQIWAVQRDLEMWCFLFCFVFFTKCCNTGDNLSSLNENFNKTAKLSSSRSFSTHTVNPAAPASWPRLSSDCLEPDRLYILQIYTLGVQFNADLWRFSNLYNNI